MIYETKQFDKKAIKNFHLFNQSEIEGALSFVDATGTGVHITINDSNFTFWPIETAFRGKRKFYQWAIPGDSIVKRAYSDVLILYKDERTYQYSFRKNED